jgi:thiol-disulfide isomerase/thioredoxin
MLKPDSFFIGRSIKILKYETIEGNNIDSTYFASNKLTFITLFTLGCAPCMQEVEYLNKLQEYCKGKEIGVISFTPNSKESIVAFNADKGTPSKVTATQYIYYRAVPPIKYPVVSITYKQIKDLLQIDYLANPSSFIVDRKGTILFFHCGFPMLAAYKEKTYLKYKNAIDQLLLK